MAAYDPKFDLNGDGRIDDADYNIFSLYYGRLVDVNDPLSIACDFNSDGKINITDFGLFALRYGATKLELKKGDISWDLSPYIVYTPGFDIGCNIFVSNPGVTARKYSLMARLSREAVTLNEEAVPVSGYTWFEVVPGDSVELEGAFNFAETNATLTLQLIDKDTEEVVDSTVTLLNAPGVSALPPAWPPAPGSTTAPDWSSMFTAALPALTMVMFGAVMVSAFKPKQPVPGRRNE